MTQNLSQLEHNDAFIQRHIGSSAEQQQQMLAAVGANSLSALIQQIVPADIQLPSPPPVGKPSQNIRRWRNLKGSPARISAINPISAWATARF